GMMRGRRRSPGREFAGPERGNRIGWTAPLLFCLAASASSARAADLDQAEALYRAGKYDECARLAEQEIAGRGWGDRWRSLKLAAELARGKYAEALTSLEDALGQFPASLPLRLQALDVYRYNNRPEEVARELEMLERVVMGSPQRHATPEGRVALGRYFLL